MKKSPPIFRTVVSTLAALAFSPAYCATPDTNYTNLNVSGFILAQGLESSPASGLEPAIAPTNCPLIANAGGRFADCSNYQDSSPSDIGNYFGFRAGSWGGTNVEIDLNGPGPVPYSSAGSGSALASGWGQNPMTVFWPGSGDGSVTKVLLENDNPGSGLEYNGIVLEGTGSGNDLAAISANGVSGNIIWSKAVSIESGVALDGVLDTTNSWTGLSLQASHDTGITVDPGTILTTALMVLPSDPQPGVSNTQLMWTPLNGAAIGTWQIGPMHADNSSCGLCVQTPPSSSGSIGEVVFTPGAGLSVTGTLAYGAAHGRGGLVIEERLLGTGSGSIALTPSGGGETATNNAGALAATSFSSDGSVSALPTNPQSVSALIACSGGTSTPSVIQIDGILAGSPLQVLSQTPVRLIGNATSPTASITTDGSGSLVPIVTSQTQTTCVAATKIIENLGPLGVQ